MDCGAMKLAHEPKTMEITRQLSYLIRTAAVIICKERRFCPFAAFGGVMRCDSEYSKDFVIRQSGPSVFSSPVPL
jgi:hypothetical protein